MGASDLPSSMRLQSQIGFLLEGLLSVARAAAGNLSLLKHLASINFECSIAGLRYVARLGATACTPTQFVHFLRMCSIQLLTQVVVCCAAWCGGQRICFVHALIEPDARGKQ